MHATQHESLDVSYEAPQVIVLGSVCDLTEQITLKGGTKADSQSFLGEGTVSASVG